MNLSTGQVAPEFNLPDAQGVMHSLKQYAGKWVLLYFYPKDDTAGCTTEACGIRDSWEEFKKQGIVVLGVSADSEKSHQKFINKYQLPFTLLSDESKTVINAYNSWGQKKFMGREYDGILRNSFLINPQGQIAKIYEGVKPETHATEVLRDTKTL